MRITSNIYITKNKTSNILTINAPAMCGVMLDTSPDYKDVINFYNEMKKLPQCDREDAINNGRVAIPIVLIADSNEAKEAMENVAEPVMPNPNTILTNSLEKMINFFSEFNFTPSFRFVNTLAYRVKKSKDEAMQYINNYFALTDSSYQNEIAEKIKSDEFKHIINDIAKYSAPSHIINSRLRIYYGAAGTGKTTLAQKETDNRCIVCNASMLPADLMEDFVFKNGQPDFNPSMLYDCMEKGLPLVLDEINLLPFDSLRFLQGITDGKTVVTYKNRTIHIKEGFEIIGTMNLTIGGATYGLPEPLVDRCANICKFNLTAEQLLPALA